MRRLLRILLKTLKWTGLSLSTLLLAGTVVLWVRSVWTVEGWQYIRFERNVARETGFLAGSGTCRYWCADLNNGRLSLWVWTETYSPEVQSGARYWRASDGPLTPSFLISVEVDGLDGRLCEPANSRWCFAGLDYSCSRAAISPETGKPFDELSRLHIPFWMLAVVFGLWPVGFVAWRLLRKNRRAPNQCPHCGYDLRSTPDPTGPRLARCPECGREVAAAGA